MSRPKGNLLLSRGGKGRGRDLSAGGFRLKASNQQIRSCEQKQVSSISAATSRLSSEQMSRSVLERPHTANSVITFPADTPNTPVFSDNHSTDVSA